mmetsp:Transcript_18030/g.35232  ORF Transcript_18030/g.35232 Transcript_18030/m.35232 type:complete len:267 (+) Transcript_18030:495-1295(+)
MRHDPEPTFENSSHNSWVGAVPQQTPVADFPVLFLVPFSFAFAVDSEHFHHAAGDGRAHAPPRAHVRGLHRVVRVRLDGLELLALAVYGFQLTVELLVVVHQRVHCLLLRLQDTSSHCHVAKHIQQLEFLFDRFLGADSWRFLAVAKVVRDQGVELVRLVVQDSVLGNRFVQLVLDRFQTRQALLHHRWLQFPQGQFLGVDLHLFHHGQDGVVVKDQAEEVRQLRLHLGARGVLYSLVVVVVGAISIISSSFHWVVQTRFLGETPV